MACAKGAVRVSSTSLSGKQITFTYIEPGIWFGDVAILDGDRRTHDVYAHGDTSILCVAKADFQKILSQHVEFYDAMLRLHARRIRQLYGLVEDLNTLPLRARLAKQLLHLVRSYGVPCLQHDGEIRIGLHLAQEELAQLLGASRQRVNQELKTMERELAIRIEAGGLVVRNDVRSTVNTLVDSAAIEAEGDVTLVARGSASITATAPARASPSTEPSP